MNTPTKAHIILVTLAQHGPILPLPLARLCREDKATVMEVMRWGMGVGLVKNVPGQGFRTTYDWSSKWNAAAAGRGVPGMDVVDSTVSDLKVQRVVMRELRRLRGVRMPLGYLGKVARTNGTVVLRAMQDPIRWGKVRQSDSRGEICLTLRGRT